MGKRAKKVRTNIPAEIERLIKVQAGYKCSMPGCSNTHSLQMHHIDGDPSNHDPANLLLLCGVCHPRATSGEVDRQACLLIKDTVEMRTFSLEQLKEIRPDRIRRIEELVGRKDASEPLCETDKGTREPDIHVEAAASQAVTFANANIPPPVEVLHSLMYHLYESGEFEAALGIQRMVTKTDQADAVDWFNSGVLLYETSRKDDAEEAYRKAIELDPKLAQAWSNLGVLLKETGRKDEAEAAYRRAIELEPKYVKAWGNLGNLLKKTSRKDEAEEAYRKAIELDPKSAKAWHNLAVLLSETGRRNGAEAAYRKAVEADSDNPEWHNALAYLLCETGRTDEAEDEVREALRLDPDHSYAHATLGLLCFEKDDLPEGRKGYERAIELSPEDKDLLQKYHYEYGRALARNGKAWDARKELNKALKVKSEYVPREKIEAELAGLE